MNKPYLLIAGDYYYPPVGTSGWVGCFASVEEAEAQIITGLGLHGEPMYKIRGIEETRDWYKIVDLRDWTN
jgi:hypothetical protein